MQRLLARLKDSPLGPALKIGLLKSLARAHWYAVEPLGHYGLAKKKYTHFTSPIRRYADLVVHRALFDKHPPLAETLSDTARHISDTERNSADAERDSKDTKLYAYLKAQLDSGKPEHYSALITDVRNFGFFVDVPALSMSGVVPLSTLQDDFYVFDAARGRLVGRQTRRVFKLGDNLDVQIARINMSKKQVDFRLATFAKVKAGGKPELRLFDKQGMKPDAIRYRKGRGRSEKSAPVDGHKRSMADLHGGFLSDKVPASPSCSATLSIFCRSCSAYACCMPTARAGRIIGITSS